MNDKTPAPRSSATPMVRGDLPAVAQLFFRAFRQGKAPTNEFLTYLEDLFFSSPSYDSGLASMVHRADDGSVDAALLVVPMAVSVKGRRLTGRLMSNYMTDPARPTRGGADLVLAIRARHQDFAFSDSANPISTDHWKAIGGHVLPIQSLDFRLIFRPVGWLVARHRRRIGVVGGLAAALASVLDAALHGLQPAATVNTATGAPLDRADFIAIAPGMVQRFAVHPVWSEAELGWLLDMAARHTASGPLQLRETRDARGHLCGCSVFYAQAGSIARVLNILARPGQEQAVVADLVSHAEAMGCLALEGMAQPFLMEALSRQRHLHFVPRGFYCISTRHAEIVDAAKRGDVYLGGLMGEDWSRLVTDFHD
jgi:hypothetical protein